MPNFIKNNLSHDLVLKGGALTLRPGKWQLLLPSDLNNDSIAHAVALGRAEVVEAKVKPEDVRDAAVTPLKFEGNVLGLTEDQLRAKMIQESEKEPAPEAAAESTEATVTKAKRGPKAKEATAETTPSDESGD